MNDHNEKEQASISGDAASAVETGKSDFATPLRQKKRNRLSATERKAKRKAVADDYRAGHPGLAIMLRQGLSKSQFTEILADLFMKDHLTPAEPKYEVVPASTQIKALSQFAGNDTEYVRVKHDDHGTTLTLYIMGSDNDYNQ